MTLENDLILIVCLIALLITFTGLLLTSVFKRATSDRAYVRTGYGGEIIVQNAGIFVFPIMHRVLPINLKSMCLALDLSDEFAALSKDYMKVNLSLVFYVSIIPEKKAIANAARSLGELTLSTEQLQSFFASQLTHAVRKITAGMTLHELHLQRSNFVQQIELAISDDLQRYSLQLLSVTLKHFDQTALEYFREDNAFDTEGLSKLFAAVESEKKSRHEIEQQYKLENNQKELEMEKLFLEIENKKKRIRLEQEQEIKACETASALIIAQDAMKKRNEEEQSLIISKQDQELAKQSTKITLSIRLRELLKEQMETDLIKAEAVKAEERVISARELEKKDRQVKIDLLQEKRKDEHKKEMITEIAAAKKDAAHEEAEAERIKAKGEADGVKILIDAFNSLSKSELPSDVYPKLIELVTEFCIDNNHAMRKLDIINVTANNENCSFDPISSNSKQSDDSKIQNDKLQAMLEDARHSLTKEALNTINENRM